MILDGREYNVDDCKIILKHVTAPANYFMVRLDKFRMFTVDTEKKTRSKSCCMEIFFSVVPYSGVNWLELSRRKIPNERKIIEEAFGYPPDIDFLCGDLDVYTVEEFEKLPPPDGEWRQDFFVIENGKLEEWEDYFEKIVEPDTIRDPEGIGQWWKVRYQRKIHS